MARDDFFDDYGTVYLFNVMDARPTFHDYGRIRGGADVTQCGLVMWEPVKGQRYGAVLQARHAKLFANPCRKCFA